FKIYRTKPNGTNKMILMTREFTMALGDANCKDVIILKKGTTWMSRFGYSVGIRVTMIIPTIVTVKAIYMIKVTVLLIVRASWPADLFKNKNTTTMMIINSMKIGMIGANA